MSPLLDELDDLIELANTTPAWVERQLATAVSLIEALADNATDPTVVDRLATLTSMSKRVPQVVGVDHDAVLSRAEWVNDCLLLTVAFSEPDPRRRTMFRIVGAEPRVWHQTGIDGATNEITQHSVIVRLPCLNGDLEFVVGSY